MPRPIARFVARRTPQVAASEDWIRKARRNLRVAKANLDAGFADVAGFYAQQAAEFALKALQIHRTGRFARIHDSDTSFQRLSRAPADIETRSSRHAGVCCGTISRRRGQDHAATR